MTKENLMTIVGTNLKFYRTIRHMTQTVNQLPYDRNVNQHTDNIVVLLQDKPASYLSGLEKVISIPNDTFLNSK